MTYGTYLVILVDVLGQGEKLLKLESIPIVPDQQQAALKILRDTAGRVKTTRDWFTTFLNGISKNRASIEGLPPAAREEYLRFRTFKFGIHMFSDTVVIFLPLFRDEQHGFAKAAESLWAASCLSPI
jgi:hypothetical protein